MVLWKELKIILNGKLSGWIKSYYDDGSMMKEEYYSAGNLQRSKLYGRDGLLISTYGYN